MNEITQSQPKTVCGVDTLYYYAQSNDAYASHFAQLEMALEQQLNEYEPNHYAFAHLAIIVKLGSAPLQYLNKVQGVYWFRDVNEYFKIGLLHPSIRSYQHSIQIQLQGKGIYSVGIKPLLEYINHTLLKPFCTGLFEISRADINTFVQYDFGFVSKEMFVSKKKNYHSISEFGNAKSTQTIYVGKKPFLLRLYDKKRELLKSEKKEMMEAYFIHHGFDLSLPIFNVEFEMHRVHFKNLSIRTLDEFLENITKLFKRSMDEIRLIDITSITEKDIQNNSKSRAVTLPIWEYLKESFSIESFMQSSNDLERIMQKRYTYDVQKFVTETHTLINKALTHRLPLTHEMMFTIVDRALDMAFEEKEKPYIPQKPLNKVAKKYDVLVRDKEMDIIGRYKLTKENELIAYQLPFRLLSIKELSHTITRLEASMETLPYTEQTSLSKQIRLAKNILESKKGA